MIGETIKRGIAGFSDAVAVTTPAAANLSWPLDGRLTSRFGIRHRRLHGGIDIGVRYGAEVRAVAGGRVLFSDSYSVYGNLSIVDHGGGLATVYAHQCGLLVRTGDAVNAGQVLGFAGDTGRAFNAHLHFEVRVHGSPVDPLVYLAGRTSTAVP